MAGEMEERREYAQATVACVQGMECDGGYDMRCLREGLIQDDTAPDGRAIEDLFARGFEGAEW